MLDFADAVAINKFERRGAEDALRDVRRQVTRNRERSPARPRSCRCSARSPPGSTTTASPPSTSTCGPRSGSRRACLPRWRRKVSTGMTALVPADRTRYLAEIAEAVRGYHAATAEQVEAVGAVDSIERVRTSRPRRRPRCRRRRGRAAVAVETRDLLGHYAGDAAEERGSRGSRSPAQRSSHRPAPLHRARRARAVPPQREPPGRFPFTAGAFPTKRDDEDPTRMFAGEGGRPRPTPASTTSPRASRPPAC